MDRKPKTYRSLLAVLEWEYQIYIPLKIMEYFENADSIHRECENPRKKVYGFDFKKFILKS